ncbi:MAG TPA: cupredoxin domain-containing protein [Gammaproteobacteria bacterium]|nr:cupredoxin domain-containing protein [Gammaproteobacteria bacterium]
MRRAIVFAALAMVAFAAVAADMPTYKLELNNGKLTPQRLEVKAGQRFKLVVHNTGNTPAEFESTRLRKEKVLAPGVKSFVVIHPLSPGEYGFYDEFHLPDARGTIVAK